MFCVFVPEIILAPHKWRMANNTRPMANQNFSGDVMATFSATITYLVLHGESRLGNVSPRRDAALVSGDKADF
jgi:hypothetical protein